MSKCLACELTNIISKVLLFKPVGCNRNYWIMTEIFVRLHKGKDYCRCKVYQF